jgi:hypothetical protein
MQNWVTRPVLHSGSSYVFSFRVPQEHVKPGHQAVRFSHLAALVYVLLIFPFMEEDFGDLFPGQLLNC